MAYYPLHIVVIAATVSMVAGLLAGWMVARMALSKVRDDLEETNRRLKLQSMEMERERFSRSQERLRAESLNTAAVTETSPCAGLEEEVEELRLENDVLRTQHTEETASLRDRIADLQEQITANYTDDEAIYEDIDVSVAHVPDPTDPTDPAAPAEVGPAEPVLQEAEQTDQAEHAKPSEHNPIRFHVHWVDAPTPAPKTVLKASGKTERPVFEPVINMIHTSMDDPSTSGGALQSLLGISDSLFQKLQDAGYATVGRIAKLTPAEVDSISEVLGVPAARIEMRWIPDAQMAEFSPEFSSSPGGQPQES